MESRKPETKIESRPVKKRLKKSSKPKKGSPEAIFKAIDELHKAGFTLSDIQQ